MILIFAILSLSKKFAILFAGSNGWGNYRHQADIFYMYRLLLERGFKPSDISLWAFDDIASNPANPLPGEVFNSFSDENIYPGHEAINFTGGSLSARQFTSYLKNLNTNKDDDIFFYYNDHGSEDILSCPVGPPIYSYEFSNVLIQMANQKKFKRMFIVIEACFSGSIGDRLRTSNVSIITAASNSESSYSSLYDGGVDISYSNEFSSNFFYEIETNPKHTIKSLYDNIVSKMKYSHPQIYGDLDNFNIDTFIGNPYYSISHRKRITKGTQMIHQFENIPKEEIKKLKLEQEKDKKVSENMKLFVDNLVISLAGNHSTKYYNVKVDRDVSKCHPYVLDEFFNIFTVYNLNKPESLLPLKALCVDYSKEEILKKMQIVKLNML